MSISEKWDMNRNDALAPPPYPWSVSVSWCLVEGNSNGEQRGKKELYVLLRASDLAVVVKILDAAVEAVTNNIVRVSELHIWSSAQLQRVVNAD